MKSVSREGLLSSPASGLFLTLREDVQILAFFTRQMSAILVSTKPPPHRHYREGRAYRSDVCPGLPPVSNISSSPGDSRD